MALLTFDQLWDKANSTNSVGNGLCYHPCCDIWTTRAAKAKRTSHKQLLHWRQVLNSLDKSVEDKKLALQGKMAEEGWRLPALLNEPCRYQQTHTLAQQTQSNQLNPPWQPFTTQPGLATLDFVIPTQITSQMVTPSGSSLLT